MKCEINIIDVRFVDEKFYFVFNFTFDKIHNNVKIFYQIVEIIQIFEKFEPQNRIF